MCTPFDLVLTLLFWLQLAEDCAFTVGVQVYDIVTFYSSHSNLFEFIMICLQNLCFKSYVQSNCTITDQFHLLECVYSFLSTITFKLSIYIEIIKIWIYEKLDSSKQTLVPKNVHSFDLAIILLVIFQLRSAAQNLLRTVHLYFLDFKSSDCSYTNSVQVYEILSFLLNHSNQVEFIMTCFQNLCFQSNVLSHCTISDRFHLLECVLSLIGSVCLIDEQGDPC